MVRTKSSRDCRGTIVVSLNCLPACGRWLTVRLDQRNDIWIRGRIAQTFLHHGAERSFGIGGADDSVATGVSESGTAASAGTDALRGVRHLLSVVWAVGWSNGKTQIVDGAAQSIWCRQFMAQQCNQGIAAILFRERMSFLDGVVGISPRSNPPVSESGAATTRSYNFWAISSCGWKRTRAFQ